MGILLWIIFGAFAGWISSVIMKTDANQGAGMDILMGIVGAIVGGYLMEIFGQAGITGFNLYSLIVAVIGAIVVISIGRALKNK